jgi:hypothetical protein
MQLVLLHPGLSCSNRQTAGSVDASRPGACRTLLSDERLRPKLLLGAGLEQAWSRLGADLIAAQRGLGC